MCWSSWTCKSRAVQAGVVHGTHRSGRGEPRLVGGDRSAERSKGALVRLCQTAELRADALSEDTALVPESHVAAVEAEIWRGLGRIASTTLGGRDSCLRASKPAAAAVTLSESRAWPGPGEGCEALADIAAGQLWIFSTVIHQIHQGEAADWNMMSDRIQIGSLVGWAARRSGSGERHHSSQSMTFRPGTGITSMHRPASLVSACRIAMRYLPLERIVQPHGFRAGCSHPTHRSGGGITWGHAPLQPLPTIMFSRRTPTRPLIRRPPRDWPHQHVLRSAHGDDTYARPSISAAASATKADPGAPHPVLRASSLQMPPKKAAIAAAASKSAKKKKWSKGKVKDKVGLRTSSRLILECDLLTWGIVSDSWR
ncbi:hypothetical protein L1887_61682 [Cichorium endivia]|nr:hypothetical protein L1887_61682 [Cichorium endivia]